MEFCVADLSPRQNRSRNRLNYFRFFSSSFRRRNPCCQVVGEACAAPRSSHCQRAARSAAWIAPRHARGNSEDDVRRHRDGSSTRCLRRVNRAKAFERRWRSARSVGDGSPASASGDDGEPAPSLGERRLRSMANAGVMKRTVTGPLTQFGQRSIRFTSDRIHPPQHSPDCNLFRSAPPHQCKLLLL